MVRIIEADDVFDFMGSATDVRDNTDTISFIENLIDQKQNELTKKLGRVIDAPLTVTDKLFRSGIDCTVYDDKLYFTGLYRDILTITSVKEGDTALAVVTSTARSNDYLIDAPKGCLIRNYSVWNDSDFITISGTFGYVNADGSPKDEIKVILAEMVAVASRLWKTYVQNEQVGTLETIRNDIGTSTKDLIKILTLKPI